MTKPIAIQGIKGSFHHEVAQLYFNEKAEVVECMSFDGTVDSLLKGDTDFIVMALENSIAGSIIPNYALIDTHNLSIVGEHYLDIQHNLLALKGQSISEIKEVHSHPMALLQCKIFFKDYPHIKLVEAKDTADVAKQISEQNLKGIAAIASKNAAQLYTLNILAESIQTIKHNETRFAIVKRENLEIKRKTINKASLKFELDHKRGSLATILNVVSDCKLNLTKIQSLPKLETLWKYAFFVDVTFKDYKDYEKALSIMQLMAENFKVLGEYKNARL
ncbi:prephenate dehydratase [Winogradskyella echinorum]|uniref:prephenate dehydratase n=1 Tax=Winogradskyella echinorum TaxID=538189 RepID=A0ABR6Y3Y5_9FLAO|nr:prephenate dehydratase [Winogradskyella echinorum]MBC3847461.1 prephenate dehydratase [Winogradskyella echinorum]MBC5751809.1 prephenate dehydratase [Winogradskyella echinorum]